MIARTVRNEGGLSELLRQDPTFFPIARLP